MDGYNVNEGDGAVSVCVDSGVTEGFEADLTVSLSATDGIACETSFLHFFSLCVPVCCRLSLAIQEDTGLPSAEFTVVFPSGSANGTQCSSISITDDELLEGDHEFTVTVTGAGSHAAINSLSSVTTVTIIDDEGESEVFEQAPAQLILLYFQIWQLLIWTLTVQYILKELEQ